MNHKKVIQLVIAWTLTAVFVFTVCATALSLVGWLRFDDPSQQQKLFYVLIVEVVAVAIGYFKGFIRYSHRDVETTPPKTTADPTKVAPSPSSLLDIDTAINNAEQEQAQLRRRVEDLKTDRQEIEKEVKELSHAISTAKPAPGDASGRPELDHGIEGTWLGRTGELVLTIDGDAVTGDYDWNNYTKAGHISGNVHGKFLVFDWWWDKSDERGNGFFVFDDTARTLTGGWFFDQQQPDDLYTWLRDSSDQKVHPWSYETKMA